MPPRPPFGRAAIFWTVTGLIALDTILFTMVVPALPEFAERDGFSDTVAALIFAAFPIAQLGTTLAAGGLAERLGRRPVLLMAVAGLSLATLAFAVAHGPWMLAGARALQGAAAGLVWTAALAAIADIYPPDQLGLRMGLAETAGGATGLLGPVLGGAMIAAVGVEQTFLIAAALPALGLLPLIAMPETRRRGASTPTPVLRALRILAGVPAARVAAGGLLLMAGTLAMIEPLLPLDMDRRLDLGPLGVGLVFAAGLAAHYAAMPLAGRWSDRRGRRGPLLLGTLLIAVGLPFLTFGPAVAVAAGFAVVGVGMACCAAPSGPLMVEAVATTPMAGNHGISGAALSAVFAIGYSVGPLLGAGSRLVLPFVGTALIVAGLSLALHGWIRRALPTDTTEPQGA